MKLPLFPKQAIHYLNESRWPVADVERWEEAEES